LRWTNNLERKAAIVEWLEKANFNSCISERYQEIREGIEDIGPPLGDSLQQHNDFDDWINRKEPHLLVCHGEGKPYP
jgi:hypothetical protein